MSKTNRPKGYDEPGRLKKAINDAISSIQSLKTHAESIDATLVESETALATVHALQKKNSELQEQVAALQGSNEERTRAFATATLALDLEFGKKVKACKEESESRLHELAGQHASSQNDSRLRLSEVERENRKLKAVETSARCDRENLVKEHDNKLKQVKAEYQAKFEKMQAQIESCKANNDGLNRETEEQATMLKGRDTEIGRLKGRLKSFEHFSDISPDDIKNDLSRLQNSLHEYCQRFVEAADVPPGWRDIPEDLRRDHLPTIYATNSASGRALVTALVQHAICLTLSQKIFVLTPLCTCAMMNVAAEAIYLAKQSQEPVWRLIGASILLEDDRIIDQMRDTYGEVAACLISSWQLHRNHNLRDQLREALVKLLTKCLKTWLTMMTLAERSIVVLEGDSSWFDAEEDRSAETSHKVPGSFAAPTTPPSALCLFPAFLQLPAVGQTTQRVLMRRGMLLYADSPIVLQAVEDEVVVSSPRKTTF